MRIVITLMSVAMLMLAGCAVSLHGHGGYYYRHGYYHHPHHHHHHWNAGGPAYDEAGKIKEITILNATLPSKIDGEFTSADEAKWREEWPEKAARLVAETLQKETKSPITATVSSTAPSSGYYMTLEILYIDIGDPTPNADGTPKERGSALAAHGVIMNASTNTMVADVKFDESSGWTGTMPFDGYMSAVGSSLADWFDERRGD